MNSEQVIASASRRQKWIDQSQSLNLYFNGTDGAALACCYMNAWRSGVKTTYYLRSLAAGHVDSDVVQKSMLNKKSQCSTDNTEECEVCQ